MTAQHKAFLRFWFILEYEPSWFCEWSSGFGAMLWGIIALITTAFLRTNTLAYVVPIVAICFGPLRWVALLSLRSGPRVLLALLGGVLWAWITISLYMHSGMVPALGGFAALYVLDLLTLAKFSAPYVKPRMLRDSHDAQHS